MLFDDITANKCNEAVEVKYGTPQNDFFCYFDYDERHCDKNMNTQHYHPFYEIYVLLSEQATHVIDGNYYDLSLYDIVCLRPGLLHKTFYPPGLPSKRLVIQFHYQFDAHCLQKEYQEFLSVFDSFQPIYRFDPDTQLQLMSLFRDILRKNMQKQDTMPLTTYISLLQFISFLFQHRNENQYYSNLKGNDTAVKIYAICGYIQARYSEELSLESFSKRYYISSSHLSREFHRITGFKLTEYIQRTRLRNAQHQLVFTKNKISDIASQCGFRSFSQFNRMFNKYYHTSPTEYRKLNLPNFSL